MRQLKRMGSSTVRILRRPAIWGTAVLLTAVVGAGIGLGRLVIAPALLADSAPNSTVSRHAPTVAQAPKSERRSPLVAKVFSRAAHEPQVEISLVKVERSSYRRHRRRHAPDVVYHALKNVPSFAEPDRAPEPDHAAEKPEPSEGGDDSNGTQSDRENGDG